MRAPAAGPGVTGGGAGTPRGGGTRGGRSQGPPPPGSRLGHGAAAHPRPSAGSCGDRPSSGGPPGPKGSAARESRRDERSQLRRCHPGGAGPRAPRGERHRHGAAQRHRRCGPNRDRDGAGRGSGTGASGSVLLGEIVRARGGVGSACYWRSVRRSGTGCSYRTARARSVGRSAPDAEPGRGGPALSVHARQNRGSVGGAQCSAWCRGGDGLLGCRMHGWGSHAGCRRVRSRDGSPPPALSLVSPPAPPLRDVTAGVTLGRSSWLPPRRRAVGGGGAAPGAVLRGASPAPEPTAPACTAAPGHRGALGAARCRGCFLGGSAGWGRRPLDTSVPPIGTRSPVSVGAPSCHQKGTLSESSGIQGRADFQCQ